MNTNNKNVDELIKDAEQAFLNSRQQEKKALDEIVKYNDKINDKIFTYQLFFLAAYISLVAIPTISISPYWLFFPIGCIFRLMWIDFALMEFFRKLSVITELSKRERERLAHKQKYINFVSLEVVIETLALTILFMICLIKMH